jgi:CDP-glucose 4,6-dehydratase
MKKIDLEFWRNRRVFITGHMGFKGAWLCALLSHMGAQTVGYGKDNRQELLYRQLLLPSHLHNEGDVNNFEAMSEVMNCSNAEVLFHLAAQPLVLKSYANPIETFETNLMGTVRVLQAARFVTGLKSVVIITTDKVYQNNEWVWGYREQDALGGDDPYSASKAAAEIAVHAMAKSFFHESFAPAVVTARAGNVIGGGDWAEHRLLPDAARALGAGDTLICRNPGSVRPWQHVLDPLAGYMLLAESVAEKKGAFTTWNFGPAQDDALTVGAVADIFVREWGGRASWAAQACDDSVKVESGNLMIDSSRARTELGWVPRWSSREAIKRTANWYRDYGRGVSAKDLVDRDISDFLCVAPADGGEN